MLSLIKSKKFVNGCRRIRKKLDSVKNGRRRAVALQNEVLDVVEDGAFTGEWLRKKRNEMMALKEAAERCAAIEKAGRELVKEGDSLE